MYGGLQDQLKKELAEIESAGLYKKERIIASPQGAEVKLATEKK
jgi:glycine C-acetyltransferase